MTRFYQNLLGARAGLKSPLRKAEALAESKAWLRGAGPEEAGAALAALPRGTIVRREAVAPKPAARPHEDPTYWAGFIPHRVPGLSKPRRETPTIDRAPAGADRTAKPGGRNLTR